jgi:hypothetical protein
LVSSYFTKLATEYFFSQSAIGLTISFFKHPVKGTPSDTKTGTVKLGTDILLTSTFFLPSISSRVKLQLTGCATGINVHGALNGMLLDGRYYSTVSTVSRVFS